MTEVTEAAVLADVERMLIDVIGDDLLLDGPLTMETSFDEDLQLESIEFVALSEQLLETYGEQVDFVAWLAEMTLDEIVALTHEGLKKFDGKTAVYIKPMYWAEHGGYMSVPPDPESTRFCLCLFEAPMIASSGFSVTVSPFRRPTYECAPTNAKAGCLYPNNGRAIMEAKMRGFDNALVLDMLGNVAETGTSNIFMVKDGVVFTPMPNGTFLSGITRARIISLLRETGREVVEKTLSVADFRDADEIFSTGNHSKVVPVIRIEDRDLQPGPTGARARQLYWDWAHA